MKWLSRLFRKPLLDRADAREAAMELSDTAVSHMQEGQKELAGEYFKKSIKTDPTWSASHLNYARFLFTQRNYVECAHYLESAMRNARNGSDPKNDARVLADGELLEGALRLHGVGGGTVCNSSRRWPLCMEKKSTNLHLHLTIRVTPIVLFVNRK